MVTTYEREHLAEVRRELLRVLPPGIGSLGLSVLITQWLERSDFHLSDLADLTVSLRAFARVEAPFNDHHT